MPSGEGSSGGPVRGERRLISSGAAIAIPRRRGDYAPPRRFLDVAVFIRDTAPRKLRPTDDQGRANMGYRAMGRLHAGLLQGIRGATRTAGQGTVEYVALILLVAVVLAGVVAATRRASIGDGGIARTIVSKLKSAIDTVK